MANPPKYHFDKFDPDTLPEDIVYRLIADSVPEGSHVLDLGCATGYLSQYLRENKSCNILAVDIDPANVSIAVQRGLNAFEGDADAPVTWERITDYAAKHGEFEVVIAGDVIEHLKQPDKTLKKIKGVLKKDGVLIASTPNIAYWKSRLNLLLGNFDYTEYGIMDRTHLRFFTEKTLREVALNSGFSDVTILRSFLFRGGTLYRKIRNFPPIRAILGCAGINPDNLFTFQFVLKAKN